MVRDIGRADAENAQQAAFSHERAVVDMLQADSGLYRQGLAEHKDELGAPLCPCRHYDDKQMEAQQGFWNCPCVPMRERKVPLSHFMRLLLPTCRSAIRRQESVHCTHCMPAGWFPGLLCICICV